MRAHASQRARSRAAAQTEQHCLSLIVLRVAEQYEPFAVWQRFAQRVVPRGARGCFGTAFADDVYGMHFHGVNAKALHDRRCFTGYGG